MTDAYPTPATPAPSIPRGTAYLFSTRPSCQTRRDRYLESVRTARQGKILTMLKEKLQADLSVAMKARDEVRTRTLRMALTALTNEEVSGKQARELSDEEIVRVLQREAKKRREAAEAFEGAGRTDQAEAERA